LALFENSSGLYSLLYMFFQKKQHTNQKNIFYGPKKLFAHQGLFCKSGFMIFEFFFPELKLNIHK